MTHTTATDRSLGIALVLAILAGLSALVLAVTAPAGIAAWGFAGATLGGVLSIVAYHGFAD